jgi:hypothetical protein
MRAPLRRDRAQQSGVLKVTRGCASSASRRLTACCAAGAAAGGAPGAAAAAPSAIGRRRGLAGLLLLRRRRALGWKTASARPMMMITESTIATMKFFLVHFTVALGGGRK